MKKYFYIFLFFPVLVFSQNKSTGERIYDNLQKYWNYRDRLEKYFVVADASNAPGTNIPAIKIGRTWDNVLQISYSDGNGTLQYYLGLLATEYALLKSNNLNYQPTRDKLKWALNAVDRLDLHAERYYRDNGNVDLANDLNGFFLRDDVDNSIKNHSKFPDELKCNGFTIGSQFNHGHNKDEVCGNGKTFINSRDMVWHYLLNLALVVKLVDDASIKIQAQNIAYRMVKHFHGWSESGLQTCWYVENPVCHEFVDNGGEVDWMNLSSKVTSICELSANIQGMRWGFRQAGNVITYGSGLGDLWQNTKLPGVDKTTVQNAFYNSINWMWELNGNGRPYSRTSLALVIGNPAWQSHNGNHLYDFVKNEKNNSAEHLEHFPLIYQVLHPDDPGSFNLYDETEINWYLDLFDELKDVDEPNENSSGHWYSDNRLVWSLGRNDTLFDINRIDFMLLYNLFRLVYVEKPYNYNVSVTGTACNITNYAEDEVFDASYIASGCSVIDIAGKKVKFGTGFRAVIGSSLKAKIDKSLAGYTYYKLDRNKPAPLFYLNNFCGSEGSAVQEAAKSLKMSSKAQEEYNSSNTKSVENSTLTLYPNPTKGDLNITVTGMDDKKQLNVFNLSGELIYTVSFSHNKYTLDLLKYPSGLYYIQIINYSETITQRFIKE